VYSERKLVNVTVARLQVLEDVRIIPEERTKAKHYDSGETTFQRLGLTEASSSASTLSDFPPLNHVVVWIGESIQDRFSSPPIGIVKEITSEGGGERKAWIEFVRTQALHTLRIREHLRTTQYELLVILCACQFCSVC
jgi:hypothetical protein